MNTLLPISFLKKFTLSIILIAISIGSFVPVITQAQTQAPAGSCTVVNTNFSALDNQPSWFDKEGKFFLGYDFDGGSGWFQEGKTSIILSVLTKDCVDQEIKIEIKSRRPGYLDQGIAKLEGKSFLIEKGNKEGYEIAFRVGEELCEPITSTEAALTRGPLLNFLNQKTDQEIAALLGYGTALPVFEELSGSGKEQLIEKIEEYPGDIPDQGRDLASVLIKGNPFIAKGLSKRLAEYIQESQKNLLEYKAPCEFFVEISDMQNNQLYKQSDNFLRYSCAGDAGGFFDGICEQNVAWDILKTSSNIGGISSIDKDNPCYDENGVNNRLEGCQELLAPLPGFGDRVDENLTLGTYINTLLQMVIGFMGIIAVLMIIASGVKYMTTENFGGKANAKETITNAFLGLFIAVSIFIILKTINPDLLNIEPNIGKVSVGGIELDDTQKEFINSVDTVNVVLPPQAEVLAYEPLIAYLYHQQGPGGGPTILWAAKNGYAKVPDGSPFMKNSSNINKAISAQDGNSYTPTDFVNKFYKILKLKEQKIGQIPQANRLAVEKAAQEVGMSASVLKTICMIESYDCTKAEVVNKYGYTGLFQFHPKKSWPEWRKDASAVITSPYDNAYAGARFMKSNLAKYQKDKLKM